MFCIRLLCVLCCMLCGDSKKISRPVYNRVLPKGENQNLYVDHLSNPEIKIVFGIGPAGCGKTLFACHAAVDSLLNGQSDKIVITRPLVSADEELGFLPGSILQKMDPWTRPIFDILGEFYTATQIRDMMESGVIEISPLAYMRGRTFKKSFIIADEMQNSTPNQMLMMLTRVGEDTRLAVTGDLMQSDLKPGIKNGLADFIEKYNYNQNNQNTEGSIRYVEMGSTDVQRSEVVAKVLDIYNKPKDVNNNKRTEYRPPIVSNDDAAMIPRRQFPANL